MNKYKENYKKIKKLQYWTKQTFLNKKGQETMPTLKSLEIFNKELEIINNLVKDLENNLQKKK